MPANGRLDISTLSPIGDGLYLEERAAAAWIEARVAVQSETGILPIVTKPDGAYRDIAGQIRQRAYWTARGLPHFAAVPGMSTHGLGVTVDIYNISRFNQARLEKILARFGFKRTLPSETWHFQHDGSTTSSSGIGKEITENEMSAEGEKKIIDTLLDVAKALQRIEHAQDQFNKAALPAIAAQADDEEVLSALIRQRGQVRLVRQSSTGAVAVTNLQGSYWYAFPSEDALAYYRRIGAAPETPAEEMNDADYFALRKATVGF